MWFSEFWAKIIVMNPSLCEAGIPIRVLKWKLKDFKQYDKDFKDTKKASDIVMMMCL